MTLPARLLLRLVPVVCLGGALAGPLGAGPALPLPVSGPAPGLWIPPLAQDEAELEVLLVAEREEADLLRRRGELRGAEQILRRHLTDEPADAMSRALLARVRLDQSEHERAERDARRALGDGDPGSRARVLAQRVLADIALELGRPEEALTGLPEPQTPEDARRRGDAHAALGQRAEARAAWRVGVAAPADTWEALLERGRCQQRLGELVGASRTLVASDDLARKGAGPEPDVLAALAGLYFESEREVEAAGKRSAAQLYKEALALNEGNEEALLGLFDLHRYNRRRVSRSPEEILGELLAMRPDSVRGLVASAGADLSDGQLRGFRATLERLDELAPARRDVRALHAALAWVEHRREAAEGILAELAEAGPADSMPEREVGTYLVELYRFEEAIPFLGRAVARDSADYEAWTQYAIALSNVGRETEAREAFDNAVVAAAGRQDAKRNNIRIALEKVAARHTREEHGELAFSWQPDAADVMRAYLVPFYTEARKELAARYGFTPGPTLIEIFREHRDFSVRSVGFEGFPALGVCFGPVVTALSPLSELRGQFSWARTGFHEFSHVIHLGLSHNRCPRWITEGLATWEEVRRSPSWSRNMRRELVDARANSDLIPVRELNRAFRGPRILFGYYQGGLLCEMLIDRHGFPPMVRLLEAFDRGLDIDQAFAEVFATTPEAIDREFEVFVDERIEGLTVEPRWTPRTIARTSVRLPRELPTDPEARREVAEGWTTVAWGRWREGRQIDAEEALRRAEATGLAGPRAQFLRGEIALSSNRPREAERIWLSAVESGGRDFRALIGLGSLLEGHGELEQAEHYFRLAEAAFPGYDDAQLSAELRLASLFERMGRDEEAMWAKSRWLDWNAGEYSLRAKVAGWHLEREEYAEAERRFREACEVDLFRRDTHIGWADALYGLGRFAEALREYGVARIVPADLDLDHWTLAGDTPGLDLATLSDAQKLGLDRSTVRGVPLTAIEEARIALAQARCARALGQIADALDFAGQALTLNPQSEEAEAFAEELRQGE